MIKVLDQIKSIDRTLYLLCSVSERERDREMGEKEINLLLRSRNSSWMPWRWGVWVAAVIAMVLPVAYANPRSVGDVGGGGYARSTS
jgi:hypothetical protein